MIPGFEQRRIDTSEASINLAIGGDGPPLLLLHGCPETHIMWRKIAPQLAERFTVVAPDLRGYGESSIPRGAPDHANYAFRAMAGDMVEVMETLGFDKFSAAGHDRGARVLHRMALDSPESLERIALLDILPTLTLYENLDKDFVLNYWIWVFHVQPPDMPERMISSEIGAYLENEMGRLRRNGVIEPKVWAAYTRALDTPEKAHGTCEDYRAAASIDLDHDRQDLDRKITCPVLVLWGEQNAVWERFGMIDVWRERAEEVTGFPLPCGHYLPEEAPEETLQHLLDFFPP